MSTHKHTNEGSESEGGKGKGKRIRSNQVKLKGSFVSDRWLDEELVRKRAEKNARGKLGVWEGRKFVLWRGYNGKTFDEMEDLVPFKAIGETDLYRFASVYWLVLMKFRSKIGETGKWTSEDLGMLFFMKRVQQANGDALFTKSMLRYYLDNDGLRPLSHTITLTNDWVKRMRAKGLIEQLPGLLKYHVKGQSRMKVAMFRLSASGLQLLKSVMDKFNEVQKDINYWVKTCEDAEYLRRMMCRFCLGASYEELDEAETQEDLDELVILTKRELREMGHRGTGHKPDYWPQMPE